MMTTNGASQDQSKEVEPHATHSIQWCWNEKKRKITCNKAGTVETLLQRSQEFRKTAEKHKNKELVFVMNGKAISCHFPCSLMGNDIVFVKCVKVADKSQKPISKRPLKDLLLFHVSVKGGKNVTRIMRNPELKTVVQEVTVYAVKGERMKDALRRDGRFLNVIFQKTCALVNINSEVTTEMCNLVDDSQGQTFRIVLLSKSTPPNSQSMFLEVTDFNEAPQSDLGETSQQPSTAQQANGDKTAEEPKTNGDKTPKLMQIFPISKILQSQLSLQFKLFVERRKTLVPKLSRIQNLFRVEYGQNAQLCKEVKTMKRLMELSDSVCQVRLNGSPLGTGSLLFGEFVLTSGHVAQRFYNADGMHLMDGATVHFSFESLERPDGGEKVMEVVGFQYQSDQSGCDWALLRITADEKLPDGLLSHFGFIPQEGGICLIGHPDGGVKKIDPCVIVPTENQFQVAKRHYEENQANIHLITSLFFENALKYVQGREQDLKYESCFYFGSSGSPVFDDHCNIVAVHTGGYVYPDKSGQTQSVLEYGHPLSLILEHMIIQIVQTKRFDELKKYLEVLDDARSHIIAGNVKKLVESRNLTTFQEAADHPKVANDESLRTFFEWILQKEDAVDMQTD